MVQVFFTVLYIDKNKAYLQVCLICFNRSYLCTLHMLPIRSHILRKLAVTFIAFACGSPLNGDSLALCGLCHTR